MASEQETPKAGDHVFHEPTGETWLVAYVDGDKLGWCGWPQGEAELADCRLKYVCTDEEHRQMLATIIVGGSGKRLEMAARRLNELG